MLQAAPTTTHPKYLGIGEGYEGVVAQFLGTVGMVDRCGSCAVSVCTGRFIYIYTHSNTRYISINMYIYKIT